MNSLEIDPVNGLPIHLPIAPPPPEKPPEPEVARDEAPKAPIDEDIYGTQVDTSA